MPGTGEPVTAAAASPGEVERGDTATAPVGRCDVAITRTPERSVAALSGDLETGSAWEVEKILDDELRSGASSMEVSLSGLGFVDSSGLRVFLLLQRNARRLGVPLRFVGPRGPVRRTLEFAKALDYLGIED